MDKGVLTRTSVSLHVLLYFLFSSTTDCMTHTGENISRPIISTSTASSVRRSTGTNFQKTIDISQPFTNQSGTFSFEFVTPYHMYERSPAVYQDKISTVEPKTTNGLSETMEAKESPSLHVSIDGDFSGELYIGMRIDFVLTAAYPKGTYNQILLKTYALTTCIDVGDPDCSHGKGVRSDSVRLVTAPSEVESGYTRNRMTGRLRLSTNISGIHTVEERSEVCNVNLYFHNAANIKDGQNMTTEVTLTISEKNETQHLKQIISFIARTSLPENNKTAYFDVDLSFPTFITAEKKRVTKVQFSHWIPFYKPLLTVTISDESGMMHNSLVSIYLKIVAVGNHFFPGVTWWDFNRDCHFPNVEYGGLTMKLPVSWVNRGYHYSNNTTGEDAIYFEVGTTLSETTSPGINYTFRINTLMNETEVWNSTFTMTAKDVSSNMTAQYNCKMRRLNVEKLYPTSETFVLLEITVPKMRSDVLNIHISTKAAWGENSFLIIKDVSVYKENDYIFCTSLNTSFDTDNEFGQNMAFVTLHFINKEDSFIDILVLIHLTVDSGTGSFEHTGFITVEFLYCVAGLKLSLNSPLLLLDTLGNISSQLSRIVDGNRTSCLELPNQGTSPPCFLMKLNTMWLKISSTPYNVTVVGYNISCKSHGERLLQVYHPVQREGSKEDFQEQLALCQLVSKDIAKKYGFVECSYQCRCTQTTECKEIIVFMATQAPTTSWSLCELIAKNID